MKVLTAMYTMRKGGSYDRFRIVLEAFLERKCEVHCLSLTPIRLNHAQYYNHLVIWPFGTGILARAAVLLLFPWLTLLIAWRQKVDLFLSFGSLYAFIQGIPKVVLNKSMVTLIRANPARGLAKPMEYVGLKLSDRILTVNTALQSGMIHWMGGGRKKKDVRVLPNNVPEIPKSVHREDGRIRMDLGIPTGAKVLVTAGPFSPGKNIDLLIRSLRRTRRGELFLVIFGDGFSKTGVRYRDHLKDLARRLGLQERVIFAGWHEREELWKRLRAADLFVSSSLSEGMPNAMLEALGCGLPCLGSRISGIQEILQHEDLLFDPLDEERLSEKMDRFFSDDHYGRRVTDLCKERSRALSFDWKTKLYEMVNEKMDACS